MEELQVLWIGISAQDFTKPVGDRRFTLRCMLMWTISDYPDYGLVSGICTHGFKGCVVCGPEINSRSAKSSNKLNAEGKVCSSKLVFGGGRRWLRRSHPYRRYMQFNGRRERRGPPVRMSAEETICCGRERKAYIRDGGRENGKYDPAKKHGVKRLNCLYDLEY